MPPNFMLKRPRITDTSNQSYGYSSLPAPLFQGQSLNFVAASSQYLSATGKTGINQQKFTIAFWFKSTTTSAQTLLDFSDGTTANRVEVNINTTGIVSIGAFTANSSVLTLVTSAVY